MLKALLRLSNNCFLVSHDQLCKNKDYKKKLLKWINISSSNNFDFIYKKKIIKETFDKVMYDKCILLFKNLEKKFYRDV